MSAVQQPESLQPQSNRVFRSILVYGGYLAGGIAVVGMIAGGLAAGGIGVLSALIGTGMSVVFMGITAGSILIANRFAGTAAASVGCLLYFVLPVYFGVQTWWATIFLALALLVCTIVTLAPLSRSKKVEAATQLAHPATLPHDIVKLDRLDEASTQAEEHV